VVDEVVTPRGQSVERTVVVDLFVVRVTVLAGVGVLEADLVPVVPVETSGTAHHVHDRDLHAGI